MHFGEVFTGLNVAAKSILRKFEVFTTENLAAYQIAYEFHTKCLSKIRTKFEKLVCYLFESLINRFSQKTNPEYLSKFVQQIASDIGTNNFPERRFYKKRRETEYGMLTATRWLLAKIT